MILAEGESGSETCEVVLGALDRSAHEGNYDRLKSLRRLMARDEASQGGSCLVERSCEYFRLYG